MSDMTDNSETARIQADIERTRSDLDRTLAAIERRLEPGQLMEDGLHYLRNNGATEYVANLGTAAKADPIPLALVGVGIAWLMMSNGRNRTADDGAFDGSVGSKAGDIASTVGDKARDTASSVGDAASSVVSSVKGTVAGMRDKVSQTTQRLTDTAQSARDGARRVGDAARQAGSTARQGAERVRGSYDYLVTEQPLAIGAIGLALGVVLAAAAPRTRTENELLGDSSDRLKDDMAATGHEHVDKAKRAVVAAEDAARQSFVDTQPPGLVDPNGAPLQLTPPERQSPA